MRSAPIQLENVAPAGHLGHRGPDGPSSLPPPAVVAPSVSGARRVVKGRLYPGSNWICASL